MGTCDVAVAEHVSDVEVTECFIVQYSVFAFICLSFVQRKEYKEPDSTGDLLNLDSDAEHQSEKSEHPV